MELKVVGKITKVLPPQSGTSASGNVWTKQLFCFELFKAEKVEAFNKYNKVGDQVEVEFNVNCNEYKGKYYTSLQAWKVSDAQVKGVEKVEQEEEEVPF